jgi:methanogenic corrinoid protein MtbC1
MPDETIGKLKKAVLEGDTEGAEQWAKKAIEKGVDPVRRAVEGHRDLADRNGQGRYP